MWFCAQKSGRQYISRTDGLIYYAWYGNYSCFLKIIIAFQSEVSYNKEQEMEIFISIDWPVRQNINFVHKGGVMLRHRTVPR